MRGKVDVWTFRRLAVYLMGDVRRTGYSYDASFRRYERLHGIDPAIRRTAYLAGRDFISRYYTLAHAAKEVYGYVDPRALADLWIHYFGEGFLEEGERKRFSKKIARASPRGRLPEMEELLDGLDEISRIAVETSYPRWLVADLYSAMGREVEEMLRALNEDHRWLRVNLTMTDVDTAIEALRAEGVRVKKHEKLEYMLRVLEYDGPLSRLRSVSAGYVTPQDLGSAIAAEEVDEGGVILDACSAPGGKAAVLLMRRKGFVVGCDISAGRLRSEEALLRKWRMPGHRYELALCDSTRIRRRRFDQSLLDAPCTDSGDAGRNPAVKLMLEKRGAVERFTALQRALLRSVAESTRGLVVYSTCSVLPEEGELVVEGMDQVGSRLGLPSGYWGIGHRVYPHLHDSGGFFVSRLSPRRGNRYRSTGGFGRRAMAKVLVKHATVLTMVGRRVIRDGYVLVEDGFVAAVGGCCEEPPGSSSDRVLDVDGSIVMPGMIDAHAHVQEYLLRDLVDESTGADEISSRFVEPLYNRMSPDLEEAVARYFLSESLRCGVTTVATAALDPAALLRAAEEVGVRVAVGPLLGRVARPDSAVRTVAEAARARPGWVFPLVAASDLRANLEELAEGSRKWGARPFAHLSGGEGLAELLRSGSDVSRFLLAYDPRAPADLVLEAAARGAKLVACPVTLARLGRWPGFLDELYGKGARVAVGSGGFVGMAAPDQLRNAWLLALALAGKVEGAGWKALSSVTSDAADALGEGSLGRIEPGARGDLVVLDPRVRGGRPVGGDPHIYAAYRGGCQDVRAVLVGGELAWERAAEPP